MRREEQQVEMGKEEKEKRKEKKILIYFDQCEWNIK